ncbi:MAG TPA: ATP-binding protein [Planctomycetota bacterium]|nr:ATP-binding protein [Planctomycetota bacterium]HRR78546.1 ATP-binding protein [Planctomycetota bacterium]HRT96251.1 ATP-binding protein [Planctomycetota bacterium]
MPASLKAGRALRWLSLLGVAAIVATVLVLLRIERRVIREHRSLVLKGSVRYAEQSAELLRGGELLARLRALIACHPQLASLSEIADEVQAALGDIEEARAGPHEFHVLVVDEKLQRVWPPVREGDSDLTTCARHILEGEERVYVLPHDCAAQGEPPTCLCFTSPLWNGGQLVGGLVVHRQLAPVADHFTALDAKMRWVVITSQSVLLVALAAIAYSARRAIAAAERQRAKAERLAALGNLAAGVAHEIRNPLNTIALTCRYLERLIVKGTNDAALRTEANTNFEIVSGELSRLTRTLDDFVLLAKPTDLELRPCDLGSILDHTLALFAREFDQAHVRVERRGAGQLPVRGDSDRLSQVIGNILRNALQAMRDGGTLTITSQEADGAARVTFADTGPGIAAAHLPHVFEPYFTTKRAGLGLGLALSLRTVEAHGGTLAVANRPEGGVLVTMTLPLQPSTSETDNAG